MLPRFPHLAPTRLTGQESFTSASSLAAPEGMHVLGFWQWALSGLVDNVTRGLLAEFIVGSALGVVDGVRSAWDTCDLRTPGGHRIEVKSSAYLQAWAHESLSRIMFRIGPRRGFDPATGLSTTTQEWQSDVHVFCLLNHQDKATIDPLNLDQWEFSVLPTHTLRQACAGARSISLKRIRALGAEPVTFARLAPAVAIACDARD